jgi:two-component system NtrC family sensor kinase
MWYRSLSFKLIISLGLVIISGIGIFTYVSLNNFRKQLIGEVFVGATRISDTVKASTRYDMLINRRDALQNVIETIGKQKSIEKVRIFNKEGVIMFSSDKQEMGITVDKFGDKSCTACHVKEKPLPLIELSDAERTRIFPSREGYRILGMITPIYNEPDCYNAICHAHPQQQKVLGVLDISMPLAKVDENIKTAINRILSFSLLLILTLSSIIVIFIQRFVNRPVKELVKGTNKVAAGELNYKISLNSKDEIGQLALSFNKMTEDLKNANEQIQEWIKTLEQRVEERTQELQDTQYQLLQTEKLASIGKLAATVAHEINNPITGILTYTKLLRRKLKDGIPGSDELQKFQGYLATMERETERCGTIVRNMLDFARQRDPSYKPDIDVNTIINESLELMANKISIEGIKLEKRFAHLPSITADPSLLKQAFLNIILNTCEALEHGGMLTITSEFREKDQTIKLTFIDNGKGIDPKDLQKIFDPFFTTKEKGTGLGLSVVYGIISSHHGSTEIKSKPGEGTQVIIRLPLKEA